MLSFWFSVIFPSVQCHKFLQLPLSCLSGGPQHVCLAHCGRKASHYEPPTHASLLSALQMVISSGHVVFTTFAFPGPWTQLFKPTLGCWNFLQAGILHSHARLREVNCITCLPLLGFDDFCTWPAHITFYCLCPLTPWELALLRTTTGGRRHARWKTDTLLLLPCILHRRPFSSTAGRHATWTFTFTMRQIDTGLNGPHFVLTQA